MSTWRDLRTEEGRKEGKKEGKKEGRKEGRKEGSIDHLVWTDGRKEGMGA